MLYFSDVPCPLKNYFQKLLINRESRLETMKARDFHRETRSNVFGCEFGWHGNEMSVLR